MSSATTRQNFTLGENTMKRWFTFAFAAITFLATVTPTFAKEVKKITFNLVAQTKFINCLGVQGGKTPTGSVVVKRGPLHDTLTLTLENIKPHLDFDLFTIQNTNLLSDGQTDPNFVNFGLAWYQSDVQSDASGEAKVVINTILLDQIFGFDPNASLGATHTFHVGFWFNDPKDAQACGFDITHPTPFNGEQSAGPNAMISVPNAATNLGPLNTEQ
jgi:hypothetical protein